MSISSEELTIDITDPNIDTKITPIPSYGEVLAFDNDNNKSILTLYIAGSFLEREIENTPVILSYKSKTPEIIDISMFDFPDFKDSDCCEELITEPLVNYEKFNYACNDLPVPTVVRRYEIFDSNKYAAVPKGYVDSKIAKTVSKEENENLLSIMYPVGSVLMSMNPDWDPGLYIANSSWMLMPENYALYTASSDSGDLLDYLMNDSGDDSSNRAKIAAGLPNITGRGIFGFYSGTDDPASGALYSYEEGSSKTIGTGTGYKRSRFGIDASKQNSIYGSSSTVQPAAIKIYTWVRIG